MDNAQKTPSSSPQATTAVDTITEDAILAARVAFNSRAREAAFTVEGLSFDDIVIARNVTSEQLGRVRGLWFEGVKPLLRADGTLVISKMTTQHQRWTRDSVAEQLAVYARSNGLRSVVDHKLSLPDGTVVIPDIALYEESAGPDAPLALWDVEVHHRRMEETVATVAHYFRQLPTLKRATVFKIFPPVQPDLTSHRRVSMAALVLVFRRAPRGEHKIEIAQAMAFGNAQIDKRVFERFVGPDLEPFKARVGLGNPAYWLPTPAWSDRSGSAADLKGFEAFLLDELAGPQAANWFNCQFFFDENGLLGLAPLFYKERVTHQAARDLIALCVSESSNDLWACSDLLIKRFAKEKNKVALDAWMVWVADNFAMVGSPRGVEDAGPKSLAFMGQYVMNATQLDANRRAYIAIGMHNPNFVMCDFYNLRGVILDRKAEGNARIKNTLCIYEGSAK